MAKTRVHELAKDMNLSSKDLLDKLQSLGLDVKNHMSTIPSGEVNRIRNMVVNLEKLPESEKVPKVENKEQPKTKFNESPIRNDVTVNTPNQHKTKSGDVGRNNNSNMNNKKPNNNTNSKPSNNAKQNTKPNQNFKTKPNNNPVPKQNIPVVEETEVSNKNNFDEYDRGRAGKEKIQTKRDKKEDEFKKKSDFRKNKRSGRDKNRRNEQKEFIPVQKHLILEGSSITVQNLAHQLNVKSVEIIKKLLELGILATINQEIDNETAILIAEEYKATVEIKATREEELMAQIELPDNPDQQVSRPPVVTIMGHVDHGKTSLLDVIRHTNVTASEAGGITQHIGAYQVEISGKKITFLDTPGHEAFTAMRARGAQVTDIAILVVAADDGVMPQTVEALNHAQAANIPIIVAVNKIDKPNANPDRVMQQLTEFGLVPEDWGGDAIFVPVSAHTKQGLDNLLEMILLVAEVGDLKANPERQARGTVIEAKLDKGRGPVATVLVQNGTLKVGEYLIAGSISGRVRAMVDDKGNRVDNAGPSTPVEIIGLSEVPMAGDVFNAMEDEKFAKQIVSDRQNQKKEEQQVRGPVSLDDLFSQIKLGDVKDLNIIIKADVQGSIEALKQSLEKLSTDEVRVRIIHNGVGGITEHDVMLASASNAIIIGFNVRPDVNARKIAESQNIDIRLYRVIYNAIDDVKAALSGLLAPEIKEVVLGRAEVRATFKVPKAGVIAGSYVIDGKIARTAEVRVIRDNVVVFEGKIDSLKRFKDDAKEVQTGYECGIGIERYNDIKEGDIIEAFIFEEIKREL